ncbi:uncharacterized protein N7511_010022 [Penicillium nucicola]|uniref:uncharacterized protein n=1 Tax=Penicillium nucicola TaxID=1850975 RepID=UPI00254566B8|nr:uncharacterized protein N7511_010022 [Penicillium nucicola]KAJ5748326.1 hypothetical protein N7511_010022 [Penicillium nucicola]
MRSTQFANRPVEPRQQSTMKWQQSKTTLVNRSSGIWYDSKDRCHQSTMEIWHKSTDKWYYSKDRCQQSVKGILCRSATRWNESADRLHMAARIQSSEMMDIMCQKQIEKQGSSPSPSPSPSSFRPQPNSPESPQSSKSRYYSQSISSSPESPSSPRIKSPLTVGNPLNGSTAGGPLGEQTLSAEAHINELWEASGRVKCVVKQTEQLRNDKMTELGEIEGEWISSTIADAEAAADDLASFIDPLWHQSNQTGSLTPKERKNWKRRDCPTALKKETRMALCYERLETVFGHLKSITSRSELASTEEEEEAELAAGGSPPVLRDTTEMSCQTTVISAIELPCPITILELQTEKAIPKIIVTQYEDEAIDVTSPHCEDAPNFPPSSYGSGPVKKNDELFFP